MSDTYKPENAVLDSEEQWFEDNFDGFVSENQAARDSLIRAASNPPKVVNDKKIMVSIRLDPQDVQSIKLQAERAGLGYQTMISSLLHQYAVGDLVNVQEVRKVFPSKIR